MRALTTLTTIMAVLSACGGTPTIAKSPAPPAVVDPEAESFDIEARSRAIRAELGVAPVAAELVETAAVAAERERADRARRERVLRRWAWESPVETRARLWNVPERTSAAATATALLRICMAEADGAERDCVGIWQVLQRIRRRTCDRALNAMITECDERGETLLSAMRRAQRYATGTVPPRRRRTVWIAELELECAQPPSWPAGSRQWARQYSRSCARTAALARRLVAGERVEPTVVGVQPITWGGRCEDGRGACDDPIACARGLARIPGTGTLNAFWCRPGTPGCSATVDPICEELARRREGTPAGPESVDGGDAPRPAGEDDVLSGAVALDDGELERLSGRPLQPRPVVDEGDPGGELHHRGRGLER